MPEQDLTVIEAVNDVSGDSGCDAYTYRTAIEISWKRDGDGREESSKTETRTGNVSTELIVAGRATGIAATHSWSYSCESGPDDSCDLTLQTQPK